MQRGQRTLRPDSKEDQHACCNCHIHRVPYDLSLSGSRLNPGMPVLRLNNTSTTFGSSRLFGRIYMERFLWRLVTYFRCSALYKCTYLLSFPVLLTPYCLLCLYVRLCYMCTMWCSVQKKPLLLVACENGWLYMFAIEALSSGNECSLLQQHRSVRVCV